MFHVLFKVCHASRRLLHFQGLRIPSLQEASFRLRQEAANLWLFLRPAAPAGLRWHPLPFPALPALRTALRQDPAAAATLLGLAERIAGGELPAFGQWIPAREGIAWRRDWVNAKETGTDYFRRVPYLDFQQAGDHKFIWEINRHQHLVTLAQAWVADGNPAWLEALEHQLESWWAQNPPQRGINWASALEVAFRALSWIWILHWTHDALPPVLRQKLIESLYLHGRHLEANLSVYFSPNTHLQGEAIVLHAIGMALDQKSWRQTGHRIAGEELQRQVLADGAHFERSSYYHVYALDFFLFHAILRREDGDPWRDTLQRMTLYLRGLLSVDGTIPLLGDDDGGRLFHPYGYRRGFGAATLATALSWLRQPLPALSPATWSEQGLWWLGTPAPAAGAAIDEPVSWRHFPASGLLCWHWPEGALYLDGGGFGALSAGHSHADSLSLVLRYRAVDVLLDPGTFSYMSGQRDQFRTSLAHNTVHAGGGQATPAGPFSWRSRPEVECQSSRDGQHVHAVCRSGAVTHSRQLHIHQDRFLWILDTVTGPPGMPVSQNWLTALPPRPGAGGESFLLGGGVTLALAGGELQMEETVRSQVYGGSEPCWRVRQSIDFLPASGTWTAGAVLDLDGLTEGPLRLSAGASGVELEWGGERCRFEFTSTV